VILIAIVVSIKKIATKKLTEWLGFQLSTRVCVDLTRKYRHRNNQQKMGINVTDLTTIILKHHGQENIPDLPRQGALRFETVQRQRNKDHP
jgi:hypothetical protein